MWYKKNKIAHQRESCIWCGSCVLIAPAQWSMDPHDGKANLQGGKPKWSQYIVGEIDADDLAVNQEAAEACPMKIIRVYD